MTSSKRPKDMTPEELDALPEFGFGVIERDGLRIPVMPAIQASYVGPDDLMTWRDREGQVWVFGQYDGGAWYKKRLHL